MYKFLFFFQNYIYLALGLIRLYNEIANRLICVFQFEIYFYILRAETVTVKRA